MKNVLEYALDNSKNVMLVGDHGVGKTQIVKQIFADRYGDDWRILSCSVLDPYVSLVGVPYIESGATETATPGWLFGVRAIFLDELNRAHDSVINAVMELILGKSINGVPLPNLEVVWAAINPDDKDYMVRTLDPAQVDRFTFIIDVPNKINTEYFSNKYGTPVANEVEKWYNTPAVQKLIKSGEISPRRVDEAVEVFFAGGEKIANFVLPLQSPKKDLFSKLQGHDGDILAQIKDCIFFTNKEEARKLLINLPVSLISDALLNLYNSGDINADNIIWLLGCAKEKAVPVLSGGREFVMFSIKNYDAIESRLDLKSLAPYSNSLSTPEQEFRKLSTELGFSFLTRQQTAQSLVSEGQAQYTFLNQGEFDLQVYSALLHQLLTTIEGKKYKSVGKARADLHLLAKGLLCIEQRMLDRPDSLQKIFKNQTILNIVSRIRGYLNYIASFFNFSQLAELNVQIKTIVNFLALALNQPKFVTSLGLMSQQLLKTLIYLSPINGMAFTAYYYEL